MNFLVLGTNINAPAKAACLMGDTNPDCIGVYKMPLDKEAAKYVETKESTGLFAPDLRWVPPPEDPKSYDEATSELLSMKAPIYNLDKLVLDGKFIEAGTTILGLLPRLTVVSSFVVDRLNLAGVIEREKLPPVDCTIRAMRLESAESELFVKLSQCDVMIGQAIRNEMGSSTVSQIQILSDVREAASLYEEMVRSIPEIRLR